MAAEQQPNAVQLTEMALGEIERAALIDEASAARLSPESAAADTIREQCGQLACRNIGRGGCPLENPYLTERYRLDLAQTCIAALGKRQPQRRP